MDSSDHHGESSSTSSSSLKRKAENDSSLIIASKRARFMATYRRQSFAFPDSIMHYIAMNPASPKVYDKMSKCCKYFYKKNPILLCSKIYYIGLDVWRASYNGGTNIVDLAEVQCKIWLTDKVDVVRGIYAKEEKPDLASSLLSKTYHCDVSSLILSRQTLSYEELLLLSSNIRDLTLNKVTVTQEDGFILPFEKVFEAFPNVKIVKIAGVRNDPTITSKTFTELTKLPHFNTLNFCRFENLSDAFDIEGFYTYMKKNKHTTFCLLFSDNISAAFKARIQAIMDEIRDDRNRDYRAPVLLFSLA